MTPRILPLLCAAIGLLFATASCTKKADTSDFTTFYTQFHQDSIFQIAHVVFPLEGMPDNALQSGVDLNAFRWTRADWKMHHPIDFKKSGFKQALQTFGEDLIIERIVHETGNYAMLRRFARIGDQWMLIYYAGLNPIKE